MIRVTQDSFTMSDILRELSGIFAYEAQSKGIQFIIETSESSNNELKADRKFALHILFTVL